MVVGMGCSALLCSAYMLYSWILNWLNYISFHWILAEHTSANETGPSGMVFQFLGSFSNVENTTDCCACHGSQWQQQKHNQTTKKREQKIVTFVIQVNCNCFIWIEYVCEIVILWYCILMGVPVVQYTVCIPYQPIHVLLQCMHSWLSLSKYNECLE